MWLHVFGDDDAGYCYHGTGEIYGQHGKHYEGDGEYFGNDEYYYDDGLDDYGCDQDAVYYQNGDGEIDASAEPPWLVKGGKSKAVYRITTLPSKLTS